MVVSVSSPFDGLSLITTEIPRAFNNVFRFGRHVGAMIQMSLQAKVPAEADARVLEARFSPPRQSSKLVGTELDIRM